MSILEMVCRAHPLEVIAHGALVIFCGGVFTVCMIGLLWKEREADEVANDAD